MPVTVLKLGGSLLDLPDLATRVRGVLKQLSGDKPLLICGGGEAADLVRHWHERFEFSEERSHWLALEAARFNQCLLLELLPELELVSNRFAAESAWQRDRVPLLDLKAFVAIEETSSHNSPPHTWDVTSDSLAAWVAVRWSAPKLLLLKSTDLSSTTTWQQAAAAGLVDDYFPKIAPQIPAVTWLNVRYTDATPM